VSYLYDLDPDLAMAEAQRRYDIAAQTDDRGAMVGDLNFMGNILLANGAVDEALARFRESVQMAESADIPDEVQEAARRNHLFDAARCSLAAGDVEAATTMAAQYAEAVAVYDVRFEVQQSHELNAMLEIANGDDQAALLELDQANQLNPRVMLLRAQALQRMGDVDDARAALLGLVDFNQLNINLAYERPKAQKMVEEL
jgi:tetratricopeptide (TPR) repeat protein